MNVSRQVDVTATSVYDWILNYKGISRQEPKNSRYRLLFVHATRGKSMWFEESISLPT